jgi:hypothetical protein
MQKEAQCHNTTIIFIQQPIVTTLPEISTSLNDALTKETIKASGISPAPCGSQPYWLLLYADATLKSTTAQKSSEFGKPGSKPASLYGRMLNRRYLLMTRFHRWSTCRYLTKRKAGLSLYWEMLQCNNCDLTENPYFSALLSLIKTVLQQLLITKMQHVF